MASPEDVASRVVAIERRLLFLEGNVLNATAEAANAARAAHAELARRVGRVPSSAESRLDGRVDDRLKSHARELEELRNSLGARADELARVGVALGRVESQLGSRPDFSDHPADPAATPEKRGVSVGRLGGLETDVAELKHALQSKSSQDASFHHREKRKGAALFGEVVRLGEQITAADARSAKAAAQLSVRIAELELRAGLQEKGLHGAEGRDLARFGEQRRTLDQLAAHVQHAEDELRRMRSQHTSDNQRRDDAEEMLRRWVDELRQTVAQYEVQSAEKLDRAVQEVYSRIANERDTVGGDAEQARVEQLARDAEKDQERSQARRVVADRFALVEGSMQAEIRAREHQSASISRNAEERHRGLTHGLRQEELSRIEAVRNVEASLRGEMKGLGKALVDVVDRHDRSRGALEKVVRAEVRARMRSAAKQKEAFGKAVGDLEVAVNRVRAEAGAARDHAAVWGKRLKKLVEDNAERGLRTAHEEIERAVISFNTVQNDLNSRVDAAEHRAASERKGRDAAEVTLRARIEEVAATDADAISALQLVVSGNRVAAAEMIESTEARTRAKGRAMNKAVQGIVANASADLHRELEKLRKETAAGMGSTRLRMRHSMGMHALRLDELGESLSTLRHEMEVKGAMANLVDAVVTQNLEKRATTREVFMKAQHAELSSTVLAIVAEARRETNRMCADIRSCVDGCNQRVTSLEHAGIATAATVDGNHHQILAGLARDRRANLAARNALRELTLAVSGKAGELYEHLAVQMEVYRLTTQTVEGSLRNEVHSVEREVCADRARVQGELQRVNDHVDKNRDVSARLRTSVDDVYAMSKLESRGQVRLWQRSVQFARDWREGEVRDASVGAGTSGGDGVRNNTGDGVTNSGYTSYDAYNNERATYMRNSHNTQHPPVFPPLLPLDE